MAGEPQGYSFADSVDGWPGQNPVARIGLSGPAVTHITNNWKSSASADLWAPTDADRFFQKSAAPEGYRRA